MRATEHKETGEKMHVYEVGYLIVPTVTEEKVGEEVATIRASIEQNGGAVISEESPKLRKLSYSIAKVVDSKKHNHDEAYFGWVKFEVPVANLSKIEEGLKKEKNILRYLVMKTIRENTMFTQRIPDVVAEKPDEVSLKTSELATAPEEKKIVSQDEIDKSIDALVIN